jgi:hypothetical protein
MDSKNLKIRAILAILVFVVFCPLVAIYIEAITSKVLLIGALVLMVRWNVLDYFKSLKK